MRYLLFKRKIHDILESGNNMRHPGYAIYKLTSVINSGETENSETIIAKALLSIRDEIEGRSMDDIAAEFFVSQAGISRFIRKLGYKNFNEFKSDLQASAFNMKTRTPVIGKDYESASEDLYEEMKRVAEGIRTLNRKDVLKTVEGLKKYKNIYFIGSELSMNILRLLQLKLISQGKNVYTVYKERYQTETLNKLTDDDLLIAVSMGQRWYISIADELKAKKRHGRRILWTVCEDHQDRDQFDRIVMIGHTDDPNIGYHYLMQFAMIIYQMM